MLASRLVLVFAFAIITHINNEKMAMISPMNIVNTQDNFLIVSL